MSQNLNPEIKRTSMKSYRLLWLCVLGGMAIPFILPQLGIIFGPVIFLLSAISFLFLQLNLGLRIGTTISLIIFGILIWPHYSELYAQYLFYMAIEQ